MAIKERSQIKGTKAQIDAFAGHEGVLGFAIDTKHLHVFSGTAGSSTEFLPKEETATKEYVDNQDSTIATELINNYARKATVTALSETVDTKLATATFNTEIAKYTPKSTYDAEVPLKLDEATLRTALEELIVEYGGTVPTD